MSEIKTLTLSLKEVRENVDSYHSKWFETISAMCSEVGTVPAMPRICSRQRHRASTPAINPSEYYKRTITIPIVDHLLELDRRFTSHQKTALQGQYLVPSVLVTEDLSTVERASIKVGDLYAVDLPDVSSLSAEIHTWYIKWKSEEKEHGLSALPSTLYSLFNNAPNFKLLPQHQSSSHSSLYSTSDLLHC